MAVGTWALVSLLGLGFVHCQTMATAMLVALAQDSVTGKAAQASVSKDSQREG